MPGHYVYLSISYELIRLLRAFLRESRKSGKKTLFHIGLKISVSGLKFLEGDFALGSVLVLLFPPLRGKVFRLEKSVGIIASAAVFTSQKKNLF